MRIRDKGGSVWGALRATLEPGEGSVKHVPLLASRVTPSKGHKGSRVTRDFGVRCLTAKPGAWLALDLHWVTR